MPVAHTPHVDELAAGEKLPFPQAVHALSPVADAYVPAEHMTHNPVRPDTYIPLPQTTHRPVLLRANPLVQLYAQPRELLDALV